MSNSVTNRFRELVKKKINTRLNGPSTVKTSVYFLRILDLMGENSILTLHKDRPLKILNEYFIVVNILAIFNEYTVGNMDIFDKTDVVVDEINPLYGCSHIEKLLTKKTISPAVTAEFILYLKTMAYNIVSKHSHVDCNDGLNEAIIHY